MPDHPIHQHHDLSRTAPSLATLEQREEVVYYCLETVKAQLNFNTQGNISLRLRRGGDEGGDAMLITPSGTRYDRLRPEHLFVVSLETGEVLESPRNGTMPSTETPVHVEHYRRRPDVGAIVHTESTHVNAFGILGEGIDPVLLNMILYARGRVPCMPFEFSTQADFGRRSAELMGEDVNAVIWANHGLLAVHVDLPCAYRVACAVEENAKVLLASRALGGTPRVLDLAAIDIPEGAPLP
ncbi:class II aldolase/adducin family protein [Brachybacterium sp. p3-SID957]|uniref:class II aldolase/adducin family protein n=1 Tax=Brachybacterium sp. p3-SID957 TaxID=2916049 RepID=UPI00223C0BC5|nr:class II aldolase/adducin family protein [Brachybacterium sp. p3-SID957]MCT1776265.1 class II aldolase/adducin family protein [Brachybacterium sp. p3-SID957]